MRLAVALAYALATGFLLGCTIAHLLFLAAAR